MDIFRKSSVRQGLRISSNAKSQVEEGKVTDTYARTIFLSSYTMVSMSIHTTRRVSAISLCATNAISTLRCIPFPRRQHQIHASHQTHEWSFLLIWLGSLHDL